MKKAYSIPTIESQSIETFVALMGTSPADPSKTDGGKTGTLSAPKKVY